MSDSHWEFACRWYRESEIEHFLSRQRKNLLTDSDTPVPEDIYSTEFAFWLTNQYRLAMNKGIQVGLEINLTSAQETSNIPKEGVR